jgi:nicotinamidase-related amidase
MPFFSSSRAVSITSHRFNLSVEETFEMNRSFPKAEAAATALVLMDFQPAVLAGLSDFDTTELLDRAENAVSWARANSVRVAHVRVAFTNADLAAIPDRNRAFSVLKGGGILKEGSPECEIVDALKPEPHDIAVRKTRFGSFSTTHLHLQLREAGVQSLVLAGVTTSGVVLSTVRDGADKDLGLYVLSDACADGDPEVHRVLVDKVFPQQAHVIGTAQLGDLF